MALNEILHEYQAALRRDVCSRCPARPPGGPPCLPRGRRCGVELHLEQLVDLVHANASARIDPYVDDFHNLVCSDCLNRPTSQCPCPLDYLVLLAVESIERVDQERLVEKMPPS